MLACVQRVLEAKVTVDDETVGEISAGLVVLLGVATDDEASDASWMAKKLVGLRIFEDAGGKMNRSIQEVQGDILAISQFTLFGDCRKGKRPSFLDAAPLEKAEELYEQFVQEVQAAGVSVATGRFRTHMLVSLINDGPVTLNVQSPRK